VRGRLDDEEKAQSKELKKVGKRRFNCRPLHSDGELYQAEPRPDDKAPAPSGSSDGLDYKILHPGQGM
jgi:hypothetical protein